MSGSRLASACLLVCLGTPAAAWAGHTARGSTEAGTGREEPVEAEFEEVELEEDDLGPDASAAASSEAPDPDAFDVDGPGEGGAPAQAIVDGTVFGGPTVGVGSGAVLPEGIPTLAPGEIELAGPRWRALQPEVERVPGPMLLRRALRLVAVPGGIEIQGQWWIHHEAEPRGRTGRSADRWFANQLFGPGVHLQSCTWNGRDATVWSGGQGPLVVERVPAGRGTTVLQAVAFLPGDPASGLDVSVLGAPRGTVALEGFAAEVTLQATDDLRPVLSAEGAPRTHATAASRLRLHVEPPSPQHDRGPVVVARVGLGLTVGDAEVRGQGRLQWEIRQGTRTTVAFTADGLGEDLTVEGPQLAAWRREGGQVVVDLSGAVEGLVDLRLAWSVAAPPGTEAEVPLPSIVPQDVFRSTSAVQIARDGEVDVRPRITGYAPIASAQLPAWAEGLVQGSPTAAFASRGATHGEGALELLRLEPVPGPPLVVDVADLRIATTEQGRMILRARYEVRNERASQLVITPPPGTALVGVTVAGRTVVPARDGDALRIPLKRSIETVRGPMTVPVTVGLLADGDDAWARRERRALELPVVDAPVTVQRVSLYLPPGYHSRLHPGERAVVEWFSQGDQVGYGLDDERQIAQADRVLAAAVDAWNDNEFARAQDLLGMMGGLGASSDANVEGLQANVDLVLPRSAPESEPDSVYYFADDDIEGELLDVDMDMDAPAQRSMPRPAPPAPSSAVARRIRARARARSAGKRAQLHERKSKAKSLRDEGRYEEAAAEYRQAIEETRELDMLEDEESVEYEYEAAELEEELEAVEEHTASEADDGGGGGDAESISEFIGDDGEYDLVGGVLGRLGVFEALADEVEEPQPGTAEALGAGGGMGMPTASVTRDPVALGPVLLVPRAGVVVRYEHLLLEAGERRPVDIHARRELRRAEP